MDNSNEKQSKGNSLSKVSKKGKNGDLNAKAPKRQTVYLPAHLAKWLKLHAVEYDRNMSDIITQLLEEYQMRIEGK